MTNELLSNAAIAGVKVPDSKLGKAITEFIRDTENDLLFNHSSRVYYFGAIAGNQRGLSVNPELLYAATMFHDIGLMPSHSSANLRFEVHVPTLRATSFKVGKLIRRTSRRSGPASRSTLRRECPSSCTQ